MLCRRADLLSLSYMVAYPACMAWQWFNGIEWVLMAVMLVLSVGLSVVQHNHTHLRMWSSKPLNKATDLWLSIIQATPSFVFFPAHIGNHHRYKHGPEDTTRTYRFGGHHNNILGYLVYPIQALCVLPKTLLGYMKKRASGRDLWPLIELGAIVAVSVFLASIDVRLWAILVLAPQLHGLHWLLGANYLQHAGAQPGLGPEASSGENIDYSRNFTGWINLIWFNIGYHTAHHENGRIHWSDLPQQHRSYEHRVPDWLKVNSLAWYFVRVLMFQRGQVRFRTESSAEMGRKI